jgi:hypothetical protein
MSRTFTYHALSGYIHRDTDKAIHFEVIEIDGVPVEESKKEWFPLSQCSKITRQAKGSQEMDKIEVSAWILSTKGYI